MNHFETDLWTTHLPEGWQGEASDDAEEGVVLFDPDGVGELQITVTEKDDGLIDEEDLEYFAEDLIEQDIPFKRVRIGEFQGLQFEFEEDGEDGPEFVREWYLAFDELFFYVTYACDVADKHQEDKAVHDILKAIAFH
ncbi:MAG: hypothetical protein R3217_10660 [Gammaproteobacteria bacterium]|nr:hypothetical protein [Gammaproteobacteria bacterium]